MASANDHITFRRERSAPPPPPSKERTPPKAPAIDKDHDHSNANGHGNIGNVHHSNGNGHHSTEVSPELIKPFVDVHAMEWPRINLGLTRKEKEDDFLIMKGTSKLPQRPKKRPKVVEKALHVSDE